MLTPEDAAKEVLRRRRARASLVDYARFIEVPGAPSGSIDDEDDENLFYRPVETTLARHHELILSATQRCIERHSGRTMLFLPPGSAKSTYATVVSPTWIMGRRPGFKTIAVSYGSELARRFGRRMRAICRQAGYKALFSAALSSESSAAHEWALDNGSEFMGGGILSGITGNRADCLMAGTMVETDAGPIYIEDLESCASSYKVLSLSHDKNRLEFKAIEAFAVREGAGIYRVTTASGRVVESTGNHPLYTERGYIEAASLAPGDRLLCLVPRGGDEDGIRIQQVGEELPQGSLLLTGVQPGACVLQESQALREVRRAMREEDNAVLQFVQTEGSDKAEGHTSADDHSVPDMPKPIQGNLEGEEARRVLLKNMRGHRAFTTDVRARQPKVEARGNAAQGATALGASIQGNEETHTRARRQGVQGLQRSASRSCAPHRQLADEQQCGKSGHSLPAVPQGSTQAHRWETELDYVVSVERIGETARVFDIQVSENHNFFANGILVHNCVLIDDPIKGRQEADSETTRKSTIEAYQDDVLTRLKPGGSLMLTQTRWHGADLAGSILPEKWAGESGMIECRDGNVWEVICIQAKCSRRDDPLGRQVGEYLWPEWFPADHWKTFERIPRTWSSLYQQVPSPDEGLYFKREWFRYCNELPKHLRYYGASDYAVTADGGDYTVHIVVGVDPDDNLYVIDLWRQQTDSNVWIDVFCDLVKKHKPLMWAEEHGQILKSLGPFIDKRMRERKAYCAREQFNSTTDKPTRARSFQARMAMGKVYFPVGASWLPDLEAELLSFPAGKNDDQVDAAGLAGRLLDEMVAAHVPVEEKTNNLKDYGYTYGGADESDSWRTL